MQRQCPDSWRDPAQLISKAIDDAVTCLSATGPPVDGVQAVCLPFEYEQTRSGSLELGGNFGAGVSTHLFMRSSFLVVHLRRLTLCFLSLTSSGHHVTVCLSAEANSSVFHMRSSPHAPRTPHLTAWLQSFQRTDETEARYELWQHYQASAEDA